MSLVSTQSTPSSVFSEVRWYPTRDAFTEGETDKIQEIFNRVILSEQIRSPNDFLDSIIEDILLYEARNTSYKINSSGKGEITHKGKTISASFFLRNVKWQDYRLKKIYEKPALKFTDNDTDFYERQAHLYKKLCLAEKYAIREYTSSGYYEINEVLRTGKVDDFYESPSEVDADFKRILVIICCIVSGLNKIPVTDDGLYVYRVMGNQSSLIKASRIHAEFYNQGFYSTSKFRPWGDLYGSDQSLLVIRNPQIAKDISGLSHFPNEDERLIPPGVKMIPVGEAEVKDDQGKFIAYLMDLKA